MNISISRAKFIKKYSAKIATMKPEEAAAFLWDEAKKHWSDGFATARLTEWDTKTGLAKQFVEEQK